MNARPLIPFSRPTLVGTENAYLEEVFARRLFSGNREYGRRCGLWLQDRFGSPAALVTPSGTHALEMMALLLDLCEGDEVITASFGFASTANAFALRGAKIVFVDVRPDTMNIDESLIEDAITDRTRAIVAMHYAGVACEMDSITEIARRHGIVLLEDAAQAILSRYRGRYCGTFGRLACFSFHESKNIHCGEGGALLVNSADDVERAEIVQEKGTNRSQFFRGEVGRYTWVELGSSQLASELSAAFLLAQLESAADVNASRRKTWGLYFDGLASLAQSGAIELPTVPDECQHNGHCFYVKTADLRERDAVMESLESRSVRCVFHYVPLHSAPAGRIHGRFHGEDRYTTRESERLLRLPLYCDMDESDVRWVIDSLYAAYGRQQG